MDAIDGVVFIGAWASLLGGFAGWILRRWGQPAAMANWLLSLSVVLFYYFLVLRPWFAGLDWGIAWGLEISRFDISAVVIPVGLLCCWLGKSSMTRGLGAAAIVGGLVIVFPGVHPIEGVEIGSDLSVG